jgi:hypothetical protein
MENFQVDAQDLSFVDIESLVEDTQLSAEGTCACGTPACMCSCSTCVQE